VLAHGLVAIANNLFTKYVAKQFFQLK